MSESTLSITTRHRTIQKTNPTIDDTENPAVLETNSKPPSKPQTRTPKKSKKPLWVKIISILIKNLALLIVLLGLFQTIRWAVFSVNRDAESLSVYGDKFSEVESFVKKTFIAMQVQLDAVDKKVDTGISSLSEELDEKIERNVGELEVKLKALETRNDGFEKFVNRFGIGNRYLSRDEFGEFFEGFMKERKGEGEVSLEEVKSYAKEVVVREIGRHSADGLGMVDYALGTGGGKVVRHSEPFVGSGKWIGIKNKVSDEAVKMISPSFGEPGSCFAVKGSGGFVEIALRTAIVPEAVTLEHVAKSVAYDRSSAPKECRVSGWIHGRGPIDGEIASKKFLLAEFTYDLNKSNAQTFKVVEFAASTLVDTIRFDFTSNHGSASHTCIYRLRMHGHEPSSVPMLEGRG